MSTNICSAERLRLSVFSSVWSNRPSPGINTPCSPTSGVIYVEVPNSAVATNESKKSNAKHETFGREKKNPTMGKSLRSNNS